MISINLTLAVDNIASCSNNLDLTDLFKHCLKQTSKVKILRLPALLLAGKSQTRLMAFLIANEICRTVACRQSLACCKYFNKPVPPNANISSQHGYDRGIIALDYKGYRFSVGGHFYLAIQTEPDISFSVSMLPRQLHAPTERHLLLARRVTRCLSAIKKKIINYPNKSTCFSPLDAFAQADWAKVQTY